MNNKKIKSKWHLEGILNNSKSWIIPLENFPFTIGRNSECSLTLASVNISRLHAKIFVKDNKLFLIDLNSTNGSFINDKQINKETILKEGDSLKFGEFAFRVYFETPITENSFEKTSLLRNPHKKNSFSRFYNLTKKETEVMQHLLSGKTNANIAEILKITAGTTKNHTLSIYKKTSTHSKFELLTLFNNFKSE